MTIVIVYDKSEEAAAGVLLGFNAIKTANNMKNIRRGTTTEQGQLYFQLDTTPIRSAGRLVKNKALPAPKFLQSSELLQDPE